MSPQEEMAIMEMLKQGGQTGQLDSQAKMAQQASQQAFAGAGQRSGRVPVGTTPLQGLMGAGAAAMGGKMQGESNAIKQQQMAAMLRMLQQGQQQPTPPAGPGMMPPKPQMPGQFSGM